MPFQDVLPVSELPQGAMKAVEVGGTEILLVRTEKGELHAVEAKCPHAGAPLAKGAVCDGRIVCPWHMGTFALADGALVEPPPLRALRCYPVQQNGDQIAVDPTPKNQPSLSNMDDKAPARPIGEHLHFVTIGGGAAAAAAVCTLRQGGFAGRLTMIDPREPEPIDRTALSKASLSGDKPVTKLPLWSAEEQAALKVDRLVARVDSLSGKQGTLRLNDGVSFGFDAALFAPGSIPRWLGVAGEDLRHVHTIRHQRDVVELDAQLAALPKEAPAVLIGDSFIAFEAASALRKRGLAVTVVCRSPQPFSKRFGEAPAQAIVGLHQANGVVLRLGAEAREITPDAVVLKSGESLPARLVIVAVGVQPATDFEHDFDVAKDGTVIVGATLKAADRVWIGGDIATVDGTHIEHWRVAEQHGRAAALGMLATAGHSPEPRFAGVPFFWTLHFGKRFGYLGHAERWEDLQLDGSVGDQKFLAFYIAEGTVKAIFGCGHDTAMASLAEKLRSPLTLEQARAVAAAA